MSILRVLFALAAACLAMPATAAPLSAYGGLPSIQDVALSADASRFAVIISDGDQRSIVVKRVSDGVVEANLQVGKVKARGIAWVGRDHLIITTSIASTIKNAVARKSEYYTIVAYDMRDRKLYPIMNDAEDSVNIINGSPAVLRGQSALMVPGLYFRPGGGRGVGALFKADLDKHKIDLVWKGSERTQRYIYDSEGVVIAQTERDVDGRWILKVRQGEAWREVKKLDASLDAPALLSTGRTAGTVLVSEDTDDGKQYREISTADAQWTDPFVTIGQTGSGQWSADGRLVAVRELVGDEIRYTAFDPEFEKLWTKVQRAFPDARARVVSWSDVPGKLIVAVDSDKEGLAYAYVDVAGKKAEWMGGGYQALTLDDIAPVETIQFKAADGLSISGYLTLPRGRAAKQLPMVVLPHGGPGERDVPGFNWLAQGIASRGYAVLMVNYRGSYGYGRGFTEAGYGQWGGKMQTDISDGVRDLARRGVVDPTRVCIAGRGFGGYAALAGAAFEPGVYRCAVAIAGISDVERFLTPMNERAQKWWLRYVGATRVTAGRLVDISPARHAKDISAPVLLMHGRDDTVIPIAQTETMAASLRREGKSVEVTMLEGEDHWLSRSATRRQSLESLMAFVEKHNPPN
jgi:dipeptidyl aminopeptidase/acylaminoacyl peptidase